MAALSVGVIQGKTQTYAVEVELAAEAAAVEE